jgi:hypothetical protein
MRVRLALFLASFATFGCLLAFAFQLPDLIVLAKRAKRTEGVVVAARPQEHGSVTVQIVIAGSTYRRDMGPYSFATGQNVEAFYDPSEPGRFTVSDPLSLLKGQASFTAAAAFLLSIFITLAVGAKAHRTLDAILTAPRLTICLVGLGCLCGFVGAVYSEGLHWQQLVSGLGVVSGCFVLTVQAFRTGATWAPLLRSNVFRAGVALLVGGEIVGVLF